MDRPLLPVSLLLCALAAAACNSEDVARFDDVGYLANDLTMLDDFEQGAIDGVWRWADGETTLRTLDRGEALLVARTVPSDLPGPTGSNTRLLPTVDGPIDEIAATLTPLDYESIGSEARAAVGLYFQPEADRGTNLHLVGLRIGLRSTGLGALSTRILTFACADESCLGNTPFPVDRGDFPQGQPAPLGVPQRLTVRVDRDAEVIELDADGQIATVEVADLPYVGLDDFYFADVRAQNRFVDEPGDEARMEVTVDDVWIDGSLYDDFSGATLDLDKWEEGNLERSAESHALVLGMGSAVPGTDVRLRLRDPERVRELAARVRVEDWWWTGVGDEPPAAWIGGFWYGDGSTEGDDGATGQVYAAVGIQGDEVGWVVARCLSTDCAEHDDLGEGSLGATSVDTDEDLFIAWNGTHFTFQRGGDTTASFNPIAAGVPPVSSTSVWKGVHVRFRHGFDGTGYMRAAFDDVRTNPTGTIALDQDGTSESWTTEEAGGAFVSLVAFGSDPDDASRVLLHATRGASDGELCGSSSCDFLQLSLDAEDVSAADGGSVTVQQVAWRDANGGSEKGGSGTVTFTRADGVGGRAEGTFAITLDDGGAVSGAFETAWLPTATAPGRGGTQVLPARVDGGCAQSVFCDFAVDSDRNTWLEVPVAEGASRTLHMDDGGSLTVYDTDAVTSLCNLGSSEEQCTVTATGDTLYVDAQGHGGEELRLGIAISEPWTELTLNAQQGDTIPSRGYRWYHVEGLSGTGAYKVAARPQDDGSGGLSLYDAGGNYLVGNGWCCFAGTSVHEDFAPAVTDEFWIRMDGDVGHAFQLLAEAVPPGDVASRAVPHTLPEYSAGGGFDTFNHVFAADEVLYLSFTTPSWPGGWRLLAEGMEWTEDKAPVGFTVFTDPGSETGSRVQTGEGDGCTSTWDEDAQRYYANCLVILEGGTTYYLRLEETGGDTGALTAVRLEAPWQPEDPIAPGESPVYTIPAGNNAHLVGYAMAGRGYRVGVDHPTTTQGGYGIFGEQPDGPSYGNGFGGAGAPGYNEAWRVRGDDVAPAIHLDVGNWDATANLSVTVRFDETGTGDTASDPFVLDDRPNTVLYDHTAALGDAFFAYTAPDSGQFSVHVGSSPWGGVPRTPVDFLVYTDPNDPDDSKVVDCTSVYNANLDRWDAQCTATMNGGTTYYLRTRERSGVTGAPYQIELTNISA